MRRLALLLLGALAIVGAAAQPAAAQSAAPPATAQPAAQPVAAQPAAQPTAAQPAAPPAAAQPGSPEVGPAQLAALLPGGILALHSAGWVQDFARSLSSRADRAGLSTLALRITLGALPLRELPDDFGAAADFTFAVALRADSALRSGYSPTLLAFDLKQVRRLGAAAEFGPGLVRAGKANRPIIHGGWNPPGAAGGAPATDGGRQGPGGDGHDAGR